MPIPIIRKDDEAVKKIMAGIVIGIILALAIPSFASAKFDRNKVISITDTWKIFYNGKEVNMDDPKQDEDYQILGYNGRTYVPVRLMMELAGCDSETMWSETNPKNIFLNNMKDAEIERLTDLLNMSKENVKLLSEKLSKYSAKIDTSVGYIYRYEDVVLTINPAENTIKYEKGGELIGVYHAK